MISDHAAKYLWDARRAAERIVRFTKGQTYADYLADEMVRAAVERQSEIVGEAFNGLRRADPGLPPAFLGCPVSWPSATC